MKSTVKTMQDLDLYIQNNLKIGKYGPYLMSRFEALIELFGRDKASQIMRNLEVNSWNLKSLK